MRSWRSFSAAAVTSLMTLWIAPAPSSAQQAAGSSQNGDLVTTTVTVDGMMKSKSGAT